MQHESHNNIRCFNVSLNLFTHSQITNLWSKMLSPFFYFSQQPVTFFDIKRASCMLRFLTIPYCFQPPNYYRTNRQTHPFSLKVFSFEYSWYDCSNYYHLFETWRNFPMFAFRHTPSQPLMYNVQTTNANAVALSFLGLFSDSFPYQHDLLD